MTRQCPYCQQAFTPSRFHPNQAVCSRAKCQRARRRDYHKAKIANDSVYRAQCRDSQRQWRDQHREYLRAYRQRKRQEQQREELLGHLGAHGTHLTANIWLLTTDESVKNIFANAHTIVLQVR